MDIFTPDALMALFILSVLEIILGIDNIIFITIVVNKLPVHQQEKARYIGLFLAMSTRILLLLSLSWVVGLTTVLFSFYGHGFSGRDLVLFIGGTFLLVKSTQEIYDGLKANHHKNKKTNSYSTSFVTSLIQIALLDIVFSLDSVITAVGLAKQLWVMITAVIISVIVMIFAVKPIGMFIEKNPSFKILALSFLLLIGISLISESLNFHIPHEYIYFSLIFSLFVEILNLQLRRLK